MKKTSSFLGTTALAVAALLFAGTAAIGDTTGTVSTSFPAFGYVARNTISAPQYFVDPIPAGAEILQIEIQTLTSAGFSNPSAVMGHRFHLNPPSSPIVPVNLMYTFGGVLLKPQSYTYVGNPPDYLYGATKSLVVIRPKRPISTVRV